MIWNCLIITGAWLVVITILIVITGGEEDE